MSALPPRAEAVRPPADPAPTLELDELWSYVGSKRQVAWVWVALCRTTRQVVACSLGDRGEESCRFLWDQVPAPWRRATCYTDFWDASQAVLPVGQHAPTGKGDGQTGHVERLNLTLRQRLGQFVRKTLSFSRSDRLHDARLLLFVHRYNQSLAITPT